MLIYTRNLDLQITIKVGVSVMPVVRLERLVPVVGLVALGRNKTRLGLSVRHKREGVSLELSQPVRLLRLVVRKRRALALVGVAYLVKSQQRLVCLEVHLQVPLKQAVVSSVLPGSLALVQHRIPAPDSALVEVCLVLAHNSSKSQRLDSLLAEQTQVAALEEVQLELVLEPVALLIIPVVVCLARTKQHLHSEVGNSSSLRHRIRSVPLAQTSKIRIKRPQALRSAVLVGNNRNQVDFSVLLTPRRIIQQVVYSVPIPKTTSSNSNPLVGYLVPLSLQPLRFSAHRNQRQQALLHSLATAQVLLTTTPAIFSEPLGATMLTRASQMLVAGSLEVPINHNRSQAGYFLLQDQRLAVACSVVILIIMLSNQLEALYLVIWDLTTSNSNPPVSSATPTTHPRGFSATRNSSRTPYNHHRL